MRVAGLVPVISVPQFLPTVRALTEMLDAAGYQLLLGQSGYDHSRDEKLLNTLISRRADGIVITGLVLACNVVFPDWKFRQPLPRDGRAPLDGNGGRKFRDECLNEQWFETLHQARSAITAWRQDYNEIRPHSSVGRIPAGTVRRAASTARWQCSSILNNHTDRLTLQPRTSSLMLVRR